MQQLQLILPVHHPSTFQITSSSARQFELCLLLLARTGVRFAYKDKTFFGHLQLYIPIFIWAYNILKAEILKNDVTITKMKHRLSKHNHLLRSTDGTESSRVAPIEELRIEDITTHFVEGTAIDLRVKQNWKAFFAKAGSVQRDDAGSSEGFTEDVIETAQTDRETQVGSMTENEDSPRPPSTTSKYFGLNFLRA